MSANDNYMSNLARFPVSVYQRAVYFLMFVLAI